MKMNFKFWMLLVPVVLGVASCSDSSDNPAPVADEKEWKADANKDTSVRPGDDFYMYCNGGYWNSTTVDEANPFKKLFLGEVAT